MNINKKISAWLKQPKYLTSLTTKILTGFFSFVLIIFVLIAYFSNPDGIWGNIVAEIIGLSLGALVVELLLMARDEQSKNNYEQMQDSAVSLNLGQNTDKGRSLIIFLNSFIVKKIKDPELYLRFKSKDGESWISVELMDGEFSSFELALNPITTEKNLNEAIIKCTEKPDELVLKWVDQNGTNRQRSWSINHLRFVQKSLEGKHDIFSASL